MLQISKLYKTHTDGQCRLCADITLNGKGTTLWFGVDEEQESYLCADRSDAFVMALLPTAMRGGHEIVCQSPMSGRLYYQLTTFLIPTLCAAGDLYHPVKITAPLTAERVPNLGAVGTGFSGGVDCLYTVMSHGEDSAYPVTHLVVFNVGAFDGKKYREYFQSACRDAEKFSVDVGYVPVYLDSNVYEVLPENFLEVCSFRNIAGAMALQGLFSVYLLSSGRAFVDIAFELNNGAAYDLLTVHCSNTESLSFYSAGGQLQRYEKLEALADWEPARRWLHPCFRRRLSSGNCGKCKKCIQTMVSLYACGVLDCFEAVFDVEEFHKSLPQNIGYLLTIQQQRFYNEPLRLLRERNIPIPPEAYQEAELLKSRGEHTATLTRTEQEDAMRALARRLRQAKQTSSADGK